MRCDRNGVGHHLGRRRCSIEIVVMPRTKLSLAWCQRRARAVTAHVLIFPSDVMAVRSTKSSARCILFFVREKIKCKIIMRNDHHENRDQ